jgi:two-component system CheB/CheR fusion protein
MRGAEALDESYVVVVGSSAGGIEALVRLVTALPAEFPAPVVIAQHADPHGPSRLGDILQRSTALQVVTIDEGEEALRPHTIYLARAGRNLGIRDSKVTGSERLQTHPTPSIDALFISAAENYGDCVIAIILTGMGTDGVAGVRAVKEAGGTILVQEPESAAFPALPAAIPRSHIDYSATLESLAPLLVTLTAGPRDADITNAEVLNAFLSQLRSRTGIDFRQYKTPTIVRRLSRLMATAGCETLKDYLRYLAAHPEGYQRLISTFLIKVTEFFRDPSLFAYLRETILPDVIDHARATRSELRFWSAGCATGEEAYSLAITLAEILGDEVETLPIRIFATDLDADAIAFARRGIYPGSALSEMSASLLAKYFTRVDDAFQVKKRIRNLTVFGEYDLGQRAPFPRIDLVLCRNVLIYFTKELQQRTLQLFAFSLRGGGYLVLGKSETTSPLPQYFASTQAALKIFRRQGDRLLIPAPTITEGAGARERASPRRVALGPIVASRRTFTADLPAPRWSLVDRLGSFLFESSIGVVVVDRNYDISTINQAARTMLGIHGQGIGEDLVHLAQVPSSELKGALDAAFRNEANGSSRQMAIPNVATSETRCIQIDCYADRTMSKEGKVEGVIVLVTDISATRRHLDDLAAQNSEYKSTLEQLSLQNSELKERQASLTEANDELTQANAELRSANEHLLISAEEAEAAAEEVETLNEEMQATSEELETLNEELQATVEELNTTNEELAARSNELEKAARDRELELVSAKQTLDTVRAVVEHTPMAVCLLDHQRRVTVASQQYIKLSESNGGTIPAVGEAWKHKGKSLKVDGDGESRTFKIEQIELPQDGSDVMLILTPE